MDAAELDLAISELETRLERLRSLYEQYFLGIEKIPPQVARKDVDRRIWELRRVKIRNTAKRFKLQTVIQRYNTFQQYWQRILREIENGTYKRHVLRAERATTRTREDQDTIAEAPPSEERPEEHAEHAGAELGRLLDSDTDLDHELERALAEAAAPTTGIRRRPDLTQPPEASLAPAPAAPQANPVGRRTVETLDLDMDGFELTSPSKAPAAARAAVSDPRAGSKLSATTRGEGVGAGPKLAPPPLRARPGAPSPRGGVLQAGQPRKAEPRGEALGRRPNPLAALAKKSPAPAATAVRKAEPRTRAAAAPANKPSAARKASASSAGLTDQRIAELHSRLLDAKRKTNEGGKVSVNGLAKSLRAAESKLRKQHKNRSIDFDVIIKDGRAVVKPFLR